MCDSMAAEASLLRSDLVGKVVSMTRTAEDWLYEEEVAAGGTDGQTAACPRPGLWITSRPLRLDWCLGRIKRAEVEWKPVDTLIRK